MRVAYILDRFPAISETFILNQVTGIIEGGCEVDVFARRRDPEENIHPDISRHGLSQSTAYFGVPHGYLGRLGGGLRIVGREGLRRPGALARSMNPAKWGKRALSLEQLYLLGCFGRLGSEAYDVVHAHFGPNGNVALALREIVGLGGRLVTSFYGYDVSQHHWSTVGTYGKLFSQGDVFVALSEDMRVQLTRMGCPGERIVKIPLSVDCERLSFRRRSLPKGRPVKILTIARLVEKKGITYSLEAIARASRRFPNLEYRVVGDGPLRETLQSRGRELGIADKVKFLGSVGHDRVREELNDADLFILASVTAADGDREGTPTALLEAQAVGLPLVSTVHAGIPEIVSDEAADYLTPERDVEALVDSLTRLLIQPERWDAIGRAGRAFVEANHERRSVARQLHKAYSQRDVVGR